MFATFKDWGTVITLVQGVAGMTLVYNAGSLDITNSSVGNTVGMLAIKING